MSFLAARNPAFDPPPNPRFRSSASTRTPGNCSRRNSALPSSEPLSTTMISFSGLPASASTTEGRYFARRSRPFQFGNHDAGRERLAGRSSRSAGGFVRSDASKSAAPIATMATSSRNGETISSGSDLISRQRMVRKRLSLRLGSSGPTPNLRPSLIQREARTCSIGRELFTLGFDALGPQRALLHGRFGGFEQPHALGQFTPRAWSSFMKRASVASAHSVLARFSASSR